MVSQFKERTQGKLLLIGPRGVHSRPQATAWGGQGRVQAQRWQNDALFIIRFCGQSAFGFLGSSKMGEFTPKRVRLRIMSAVVLSKQNPRARPREAGSL